MKLKIVLTDSAIYLAVLGIGFVLAPREIGIDAVPADASPARSRGVQWWRAPGREILPCDSSADECRLRRGRARQHASPARLGQAISWERLGRTLKVVFQAVPDEPNRASRSTDWRNPDCSYRLA